MKILFVASGNNVNGISSVVSSQADSLKKKGICIDYYLIAERKFWGYIKYAIKLKKYLRDHNVDLIHAHYALSGFAAILGGAKPLIISLMGSDINEFHWIKILTKLTFRSGLCTCIVKSEEMKMISGIKSSLIIPNGVDTGKFLPMDKKLCKSELSWPEDKIHILFAGNPERKVKNYTLAQESISRLKTKAIVLHHLSNIEHDIMPLYINAADVILLTSKWEGSPNVIKEAMACNLPVVSTAVGDVPWLLGGINGCYICESKSEDIARKMDLAIRFAQEKVQTDGRKRIFELKLDAETVADRLISLYKDKIS